MKVVILGGGPAGLTAARLLCDREICCRVLERESQVGGLAKTIEHAGYRFDIGGHRFFTKDPWVEGFWRETLGTEFRRRSRLSRIYFGDRFFHYPLRPWSALLTLGPVQSLRVAGSFLKARFTPLPEDSFEAYVVNRFGRQLFELFFKSYTERVWGIPCREIRSEWAAQRISGLSLLAAVSQPFRRNRGRVKSLIESFDYPTHGSGMMWESVKDSVERRGRRVSTRAEVVSLLHDGTRVTKVVVATGDQSEVVTGTHFLSTLPLAHLIGRLEPAPPPGVLQAAQRLSYRGFIAVNLILNKPSVFPDNWIYVHVPQARVARIQNYKNWSAAMVPDDSTTALGMEYFCFPGDDLWTLSSGDLIRLATQDLSLLGFGSAADVVEGIVHREPHAYPVYDGDYQESVRIIRAYLEQFTNLQAMGRNGLHKYNNQDHSMICARLAVENLFGASHNLWTVNSDCEYQERR